MRHLFLLFLVAACAEDIDLSSTSQDVITEHSATITAGLYHSCAVDAGTVKCWGRNNYGQLGNNSLIDSAAPVTVQGINSAVMVSAGDYHTCAVLDNATVRCWGLGASGQLGNGSTANRQVPGTVSSLAGVTSISAGGAHTCASLDTGEVRCWGSNAYGQVGTNSTTTNYTTPQVVLAHSSMSKVPVTLAGVSEVEAGKYSTCARQTTGYVACWGRNNFGQLGDGTTTNHSIAALVSSLSGTIELSVGDYHACAVIGNGRVSCWGMNLYGQLGDNSQIGRYTPVYMQRRVSPDLTYPIVNVTTVAAGGAHTCVRSAGEVWCTGRNDNEELGRPNTGYDELLAVPTQPLIYGDELAAGSAHTCVRRPGGAIVCYGKDTYGQVGELGRCPATPTLAITNVSTVNSKPMPWPLSPQPYQVLTRGGLKYTDDHDLDLTLETTGCATVSEVVWKYGVIGAASDPIEPHPDQGYTVLSTVDRDDGVRVIKLRVTSDNYGQGLTYPVSVTVTNPAGRTAQAGFTLADAAAVATATSTSGSSGTIDISRDELMNSVLAAIYEKLGDYNYYTRHGVNPYNFDYAGFQLSATADGIYFGAAMKGDLQTVVDDGGVCDPTLYVSGRFKVVLDNGNPTTQWVDGPNSSVAVPFGCVIATAGLAQAAADIIAEVYIDGRVEKRIRDKVADLTSYCDGSPTGCSVVRSISHVDGGVHVTLEHMFGSVMFHVPYNTQVNGPSVGDPMARGIGVPTDEPYVLVSGGLVQACYSTSGTCSPHTLGAAGLFNWQWPGADPQHPDDFAHPPIPDPWPDCGGNPCTFPGRVGPWQRQLGLSRDVTAVPMSQSNPGGLVGRVLRDDDTYTQLGFLGDLVCSMPAVGGTQARLVVGRNDVPNGPYYGQFGTGNADVTINFASGISTSITPCIAVSGSLAPAVADPAPLIDD